MSTPSRHRVWPWILAILAAICMLPVVFVASHFGLSNEAAVMRDGLKDVSGARWITRVQLKSGMLLFPARAIVRMLDVDDDARCAIAAVRSASVGVYELDEEGQSPDPGESLAALDKRMNRDGWERLVTVFDNNQRVLVYTKTGSWNGSDLRMCVGVIDGSELVVVSAKIRPDALMPLIERHLPEATQRL